MKINNTQVFGIESAIRSMRNPMNSWAMSDSERDYFALNEQSGSMYEGLCWENYIIGEKDLILAQRLIKAGSEHAKYLRSIQVWADMDMTRFFWSEMDTYKFNSKNSCSTIHKLLNPKNNITLDLFEYYEEDKEILGIVINRLNQIRKEFLNTNIFEEQRVLKRRAKCLLPEGFLQLRTVNTNYAEIRNIISQRKNHQMREDWVECFCKWATTLPYSKELIFCGFEEDYNKLLEIKIN